MEQVTTVCKMLSDPIRLRIIQALSISDLCVCELSDALQIGQSTLSNHLATLRHTGLVRTQRDGAWVYYQIAPNYSKQMSDLTRVLAEMGGDCETSRADQERVKKRLALRVNGKCARSYGQLQEETSTK